MKIESQFDIWFDGIEDLNEEEVITYVKEMISSGAEMAVGDVEFSYIKRIK